MPSPKPTRRPRRSFPVDSTIPQRGVPQPWRPTPTDLTTALSPAGIRIGA